MYTRISPEQVAGFRLNSDGSLSALSGSPFGVAGVALAASGTHLFTANGSQVVVFAIDPQSGSLTSQSQTAVPNAGQVAAQGNFVYATGTSSSGDEAVYGFSVAQNGALTAVSASPAFLGTSCSLCATPESIAIIPSFLVVGVGGAVHSGGAFTLFAPQASGALQPGPTIGGDSMISVALDVSGRSVFAVEGGAADVLVASIAAGKIVQSVSEPTEAFLSVAADPSGKFIVAGSASGNVISFPINADGTVGTESSRAPAGTNPGALTFDPSGRFLVVRTSSSLSVFTFANSTGALNNVGSASAGNGSGGPVIVAF